MYNLKTKQISFYVVDVLVMQNYMAMCVPFATLL